MDYYWYPYSIAFLYAQNGSHEASVNNKYDNLSIGVGKGLGNR